MKKIIKKIVSLALAVTMAIPMGIGNTQNVEGATVADSENPLNLFVKQEGNWQLVWNNVSGTSDFKGDYIAVKGGDGKDYPAYCIDPNKHGVSYAQGKEKMYDVNYQVSDPEIYNAVLNGFPYKSASELGVKSDLDAYIATKFAIWCLIFDDYKNPADWTSSDPAIKNAFTSIYNAGKSKALSPVILNITAEPINAKSDELAQNNDLLIQRFKLTGSDTYTSYGVTLPSNAPAGAKVTDENGNPKSSFGNGENFAITVPKSSIPTDEKEVIFNPTVRANFNAFDNKVVLYGVPHDDYQNYAVATPDLPRSTVAKATFINSTEPTDEPPTGGSSKLKIVKLDKGTRKGLAGAIFEVRHINNDILGTFTSDANGEINLDVEDGNYIIEEIVPPKGFVLSSQTKQEIVVKSDDGVDSVVTFENEKKPSLTVKKVDGKTGLPLANATIRIALDGGSDFVDVITDSSGTAVLQDLIEGTYVVTEIVAPNGFLLNSEKHSIKLQNGKDSTITIDNFKTPTIIVNKFDEGSGEVLPNAEFSIAEKGGSIVNEGMTDENGKFTTTDLKGDTWYTITELQAPTHYFGTTISKDVYLEKGQTLNVKFDNRMKPSLLIKKISSETGLPLAGATFKVTSTEGKTIGEFTTNENGKVDKKIKVL